MKGLLHRSRYLRRYVGCIAIYSLSERRRGGRVRESIVIQEIGIERRRAVEPRLPAHG